MSGNSYVTNRTPNSNRTAEDLARALGSARWTGRSWRTRCPSHDDRRPSLDVTEKDGHTLFICRSGCTQAEVIDALRSRGLWSSQRPPSRPVRNPFPASAFHEPTASPCCLEAPHSCAHWLEFDSDMVLAELRKNLIEAADEIRVFYETAGYKLDAATLHNELELAVGFAGSAIVPWDMNRGTVQMMIKSIAEDVVMKGQGE